MRELNFLSTGNLKWMEREDPVLVSDDDAIVRPIVVSRCDGDTLPLHHRVSRAMQVGLKTGLIDPSVGNICGRIPFKGPFAIGHEAIAEIVAVGRDVTARKVGDQVVVPWSVSCGTCPLCRRGLTSKCTTTRNGRTLAAYGFGPASGSYGGMVSDLLRVPFADHMLVPLPAGLDPLRVAAASDNLSDAWRTVVPYLQQRPGATVLVLGGGAKSIGLYAAGLAAAHGAAAVDYLDTSDARLEKAGILGANPHRLTQSGAVPNPQGYDIVAEASSRTAGMRRAIRATSPGGVCTAVGYYVGTNTGIPLMHMYANDITLHLGVSHPRAMLPELLDWINANHFPAESVTSSLVSFDDAPDAYAERTTKLVLHRPAVVTS
ncbi:zinc-binding dehydrogenase [Arthrobacter sp. ISL-72]|uniref:zinc-dependent alcohol dehydrogenase n=1 Tax=Arthrobacter sp. ISL-72 TaxID=2819114 RepID=UPI001BE5E818|nr:alcohol dehydrogenase catalytic domain-containing protein [Arthrobacter sp. ISL-72]MBT2596175.1 alcohol dehydrogenase catalytic domain-containing protein [Arthrobacter sp. ISL-72]